MDLIRISKYISLLLRHKPEMGGLCLDGNGWCDVKSLIAAVSGKFHGFNLNVLEEIVATNNKKRYAFNEDKTRIRAKQGHSINVDVELQETMPPKFLYHGTATKFQESIDKNGLLKGKRLYVHLSPDGETAVNVGKRHGIPVVYIIDCAKMIRDGFKFYLSKNGVWLTDYVPARYLDKL